MPEAPMMHTVTVISQKLDGTDRQIHHFPKVETVTIETDVEMFEKNPWPYPFPGEPRVKQYQFTLDNPAKDENDVVCYQLKDTDDHIRDQANLIYLAMQDVTEDHIVTKNSAMLVAEQLAKSLADKGYILYSKTFEVL